MPDQYGVFAAIADELVAGHVYELDTKLHVAALLESGIDHVEAKPGVDDFYKFEHGWQIRMMENEPAMKTIPAVTPADQPRTVAEA